MIDRPAVSVVGYLVKTILDILQTFIRIMAFAGTLGVIVYIGLWLSAPHLAEWNLCFGVGYFIHALRIAYRHVRNGFAPLELPGKDE